jgi:hypothetical protein
VVAASCTSRQAVGPDCSFERGGLVAVLAKMDGGALNSPLVRDAGSHPVAECPAERALVAAPSRGRVEFRRRCDGAAADCFAPSPSDQRASHHQSSARSMSASRLWKGSRYFPLSVTMTRSSYGPDPFVETSAVADTSTISARAAERGRSSAAGRGCREVDRRCLAATRHLAWATRAG